MALPPSPARPVPTATTKAAKDGHAVHCPSAADHSPDCICHARLPPAHQQVCTVYTLTVTLGLCCRSHRPWRQRTSENNRSPHTPNNPSPCHVPQSFHPHAHPNTHISQQARSCATRIWVSWACTSSHSTSSGGVCNRVCQVRTLPSLVRHTTPSLPTAAVPTHQVPSKCTHAFPSPLCAGKWDPCVETLLHSQHGQRSVQRTLHYLPARTTTTPSHFACLSRPPPSPVHALISSPPPRRLAHHTVPPFAEPPTVASATEFVTYVY